MDSAHVNTPLHWWRNMLSNHTKTWWSSDFRSLPANSHTKAIRTAHLHPETWTMAYHHNNTVRPSSISSCCHGRPEIICDKEEKPTLCYSHFYSHLSLFLFQLGSITITWCLNVVIQYKPVHNITNLAMCILNLRKESKPYKTWNNI